jgi:predicted SnoaL-like aldol condensation-catalyzing enzyme
MKVRKCQWALLALLLTPGLGNAQEAAAPQPQNEKEARNLETMRLWGAEVWGKGRIELVPELVGPEYVRHNAEGTRVVTPESYAKEIVAARDREVRFEMESASIDGDLLWTRWSSSGKGPDGEERVGKGLQVYRFEDGKLVETWNLVAPGNWE